MQWQKFSIHRTSLISLREQCLISILNAWMNFLSFKIAIKRFQSPNTEVCNGLWLKVLSMLNFAKMNIVLMLIWYKNSKFHWQASQKITLVQSLIPHKNSQPLKFLSKEAWMFQFLIRHSLTIVDLKISLAQLTKANYLNISLIITLIMVCHLWCTFK